MAGTETLPRLGRSEALGDRGEDDDELEKLLRSGHGLDSLIPKDLSGKDKIEHAADALDFESEDELAEEEDEESAASPPAAADAAAADEGDWTRDFAEDMGLLAAPDTEPRAAESAEFQAQAEEARRRFEEEERELALDQLKEWYPGFEPKIVLEMNKLFGPEPSTTQVPQPKLVRPMYMNRIKIEVAPDDSAEFVADEEELALLHPRRRRRRVTAVSKESVGKAQAELGRSIEISTTLRPVRKAEPVHAKTHLDVADWDYVLEEPAPKVPRPALRFGDLNIVDDEVYDSDDEAAILAGQPGPRRMRLDLNDRNLMFVEDRKQHAHMRRLEHENQLNISNDRAYDMLKANYQRKVRSTIGSLSIDHTQVALRLQSPFYRVKLTKQQLRAWHRPKLTTKPGTSIQFASLKTRKKRKDKSRTALELFTRTSDLTLGDNAPLFLMEYSEEHPFILSSTGMGCKLINYYRKRGAEDRNRPKLPLGETHVLDVQDRSAFWNFGFVDPGKIVPTLYNQIIRAPVFQHQPQATDFLLVKSSTHKGTKFFLRQLPFVFVTGQVFPAVLIPGPHSRKVTTVGKNRLRMAVYRVLNRRTNQRLQVKDIASYFPDQSDMQIRQRLKEFMEYQRSGDDQGFWKMKPGEHLLNEEETRAMITPEDIVLIDSMQVGQQHLEDDALYGQRADVPIGQKPKETKDQDGLSLDEQLTPWNISKNFINAIQGKAMLQLHGVGDPTGRNEGFSFLRTSMKGGFVTEFSTEDEKKLGGHSYNVALQQKAYEEEIRRIWYAQQRALTTTDPRRLPDAEKPPVRDLEGEDLSTSSRKVLQITRIVKDENDVLVRETELVTDPRVIRAYLKHRQAQSEAKLAIEKISVTDDAEANKQRRKFLEQELARLNRNADRRQARKATKQDAKLHATTRKCATCGAIGHIKTNKSCPMYNDIYLDASKAK